MVCYAGFIMAFRYFNFHARETRLKLAIETWAMITFITLTTWRRPDGKAETLTYGATMDLMIAHDLFTNCLEAERHPYFAEVAGLEVSSHFLIRRDGELVQYVPVTRRAWHAGASCHRGRERCNDYSIGIELEGEDETPYDDRQYTALQGLIHAILGAFPAITPREIAGHSDIAPERKTDPGPAFDWFRLYDGLVDQEGAS